MVNRIVPCLLNLLLSLRLKIIRFLAGHDVEVDDLVLKDFHHGGLDFYSKDLRDFEYSEKLDSRRRI